MDKGITVTIGTDCQWKRDNNLGLYCRLGTRKLKRVEKGGKEVIICMDCDESGKPTVIITKRKENK